ncbi:GerMN domain-containing protein [Lachnospiraceae bacterium LCP25S3_G4]
MKYKWKISIIIGIVLLTGVACSQTGEEKKATADKEITEEEKHAVVQSEKDNSSTVDNTPIAINVYYGNENADGFEIDQVQIDSLTPEILIQQLQKKNILPDSVTILNCDTGELDGKKTLDLNFSNDFASYINQNGSSGERMILGSVCNTFLEAYDCEWISIRVEGKFLETGHQVYSEYMEKYE